jgi:hypothetical protein
MTLARRELNRENLLDYFMLRPRGVSPEMIEDTRGLGSPKAKQLLAALVEDGDVTVRGGLYFATAIQPASEENAA